MFFNDLVLAINFGLMTVTLEEDTVFDGECFVLLCVFTSLPIKGFVSVHKAVGFGAADGGDEEVDEACADDPALFRLLLLRTVKPLKQRDNSTAALFVKLNSADIIVWR